MNKTIEAFNKVRESATRLGEAANMLMAHIDSMTAQHTPVQPVKQEPLAWLYESKFTKRVFLFRNNDILPKHIETPLYAAPVDAKAIRAEALEEAAKICDEFGPWRDTTGEDCAEAIRGLKDA